jgi:C1A family cysteine protease
MQPPSLPVVPTGSGPFNPATGIPYAKGHVRHPNKDHLIALSARRHGKRLQSMLIAAPTPAIWDSKVQGWIGPIKDQGQCGSCWDFSGTRTCEVAYFKAGVFPTDGSKLLSEQYTLSCGKNGGCNGDDNVSVLDWAKSTGLPLTSDYGPYKASAGSCAFKPSMTLYKIDDWGFADGNGGSGVTPTPAIKAAIMMYGGVGCAVAAGGSTFWNDGQGVDHGSSSSIDHDVFLRGWDDSKGKVSALVGPGNAGIKASSTTAWLMDNSWGESWGVQGSAWMAEGADAIGTEAVWAVIHSSNPPIDWGQA